MTGPSKCFASRVSAILRTEVAQIYAQRVAACLLDILQSLYHMDLALYNTDNGALVN